MHASTRMRAGASFVRIAHRAAQVVAPSLLVACGHPFPEPYETDRAVYSEFVPFADVEVELPTLATHETELLLAIRPRDIGTGGLESLLLAARRHGVPVRAWLLLDDENGYWPGEHNLPTFRGHVDDFWHWNHAAHLGVERIVVDMEPPLDISNMLAAALESGQLTDAVPILQANQDAEAYAASLSAWSDAVDDWHADGIMVDVVALPYVLDDFGDDDADIQDMFESPVDGIDWDEVGFLVYQNLYGMPGDRLGPDLIRSYGQTATDRYAERSCVGLGTVGDIGKNTSSVGYADVDALRADALAAGEVGVPRVQLFSLDGMRETGGSAHWLEKIELGMEQLVPPPSSKDDPSSIDPRVQQARDAIAVLDSL